MPLAKVTDQGNDPVKNLVLFQITYQVPLAKVVEDHLNSSTSKTSTISVLERLEEEVRDTKIKVLANLKQSKDDEKAEWKKLFVSLQMEYPKYMQLLVQILEGFLSQEVDDKIHYYEEIIVAAEEVIASIDRIMCLRGSVQLESSQIKS